MEFNKGDKVRVLRVPDTQDGKGEVTCVYTPAGDNKQYFVE
jgi:hypothetical protein